MPTGAAGGHDDAIHGAPLAGRDVEPAELGRGGVPVEPSPHGVFDRFGLLEDLLQHEVLETALGHVAGLKIQYVNAVVDVALVAMDHPQTVRGDDGQLVLGQVDDLVGIAGQRRGVAGDEMLAGAHADNQRAAEAGGNDHAGPTAKQNGQAVRTL